MNQITVELDVPVPMRDGTLLRAIDAHTIDLWSTSIVIKAGHRIRVQVTSSNFPRWDRNTNNDDPTTLRVAHQSVHHDAAHPSQLIIPVVR